MRPASGGPPEIALRSLRLPRGKGGLLHRGRVRGVHHRSRRGVLGVLAEPRRRAPGRPPRAGARAGPPSRPRAKKGTPMSVSMRPNPEDPDAGAPGRVGGPRRCPRLGSCRCSIYSGECQWLFGLSAAPATVLPAGAPALPPAPRRCLDCDHPEVHHEVDANGRLCRTCGGYCIFYTDGRHEHSDARLALHPASRVDQRAPELEHLPVRGIDLAVGNKASPSPGRLSARRAERRRARALRLCAPRVGRRLPAVVFALRLRTVTP